MVTLKKQIFDMCDKWHTFCPIWRTPCSLAHSESEGMEKMRTPFASDQSIAEKHLYNYIQVIQLQVILLYIYTELKHDQVGFLCSFQVFIWRINLSRTIDCFKIWRQLKLNIVLAEIAVNVLIGCLYISMRDYIYSPRDYIYNPANVN